MLALEHLDDLLKAHYGISFERALQTAIWLNAVADSEITDVYEPQAVTLKWHGSDRKVDYLHHIKQADTLAQLIQYDWLDTPITYNINSWGFRSSREYSEVTEPCVVALGCSLTFGTGLHEHQIWPQLLADKLGVGVVNLGTAGHGLDLNSVWLHLQGHGIQNPLAVVIYEPPPGRVAWLQHQPPDSKRYNSTTAFTTPNQNIPVVFAKNLAGTANISFIENTTPKFDKLNHNRAVLDLTTTIINNLLLNSTFQGVRNYFLIQSWCQQRNIPLIWNADRPKGLNRGLARDLKHWGAVWHEHITEVLYKQVKSALHE